MLALIIFAVLLLACSYWKLSIFLDRATNHTTNGASVTAPADDDGDVERGDNQEMLEFGKPVCEEKHVVVVMAGDDRPTFLATPIYLLSSK